MEQDALMNLLGAWWTIPNDWRLNLEFQHCQLRQWREKETISERYIFPNILDYARKIKRFYERYREDERCFYVTDINPNGAHCIYPIGHQTQLTASRVEEFYVKFPCKSLLIGENGAPPRGPILEEATFGDIHWRRLMYSPSKISIINKAWRRHEIPGSRIKTIETVSATVESFSTRQHPESSAWWTILALLPNCYSPHGLRHAIYHRSLIRNCTESLFCMVLLHVREYLQLACESRQIVEKELDDFLSENITQGVLAEDDDQSVKLFWLMQKIDAILPMIADSVNQWEWYANGNKLKSTDDIQLNNILYSYGTEEIHDYLDPDYRLAYARSLVEEIESWKEQLQGAAKSFTIMRERARTLRDGIFALTSVKEARESRILGENVKLLTYVTVFYLPLAFCTSMWAVNNMFGTGTRGFAMITTIVATVTYVVVFRLLHPTALRKYIMSTYGKVKHRFSKSENKQSSVKKSTGEERKEEGVHKTKGENKEDTKGKGKAKEPISGESTVMSEPKPSIISRLRKGKFGKKEQAASTVV
ncbi:hypothetical protein B0J14DRAFT_651052 [Halenospora varia]|nr:hypothetical protein B0J14DRAFT_651052 [Halenospora varia]